jgi:hypothetical protein
MQDVTKISGPMQVDAAAGLETIDDRESNNSSILATAKRRALVIKDFVWKVFTDSAKGVKAARLDVTIELVHWLKQVGGSTKSPTMSRLSQDRFMRRIPNITLFYATGLRYP